MSWSHGELTNSKVNWICRPSSTMFEEPSRKIQRDCGKPLANECSSCAAFESLSQFKQFHALDMIAKPAECAVCIIYTYKYIYTNLSVCVLCWLPILMLQSYKTINIHKNTAEFSSMFIDFPQTLNRSIHGHGTPPEKGAGLVTGAGAAWTWGALPSQDSRTRGS